MPLAEVASPSVGLHRLLTSWQLSDPFAVTALVIQVVALAWYLGAAKRLAGRGRAWSRWRTTSFIAGLISLTIVVVSGVASYDDSVFVVHIVQHIVLMMVAPPLLALGAPITLAIQASNRSMQSRIVRLLQSRVLRLLTLPLLAALLYYLSMYAYLLTSLYPFAIRHRAVHDLSHVVMFALGCLFWWPMVATDQLPHRPSFPVRIIAVFLGMPFEVFLGLALFNSSTPIAPEHSLADTRAGGAVFWGVSMLITFAAALVMLAQWMREEERRATRQERRSDAREGHRADAREARRLEIWEAARAAKLSASTQRPTPPGVPPAGQPGHRAEQAPPP